MPNLTRLSQCTAYCHINNQCRPCLGCSHIRQIQMRVVFPAIPSNLEVAGCTDTGRVHIRSLVETSVYPSSHPLDSVRRAHSHPKIIAEYITIREPNRHYRLPHRIDPSTRRRAMVLHSLLRAGARRMTGRRRALLVKPVRPPKSSVSLSSDLSDNEHIHESLRSLLCPYA